MRKVIFSIFAMTAAWPSFAMAQSNLEKTKDLGELSVNFTCADPIGFRTINFAQGLTNGYNVISFQIEIKQFSATNFDMYCQTSQTDQETWGSLTECQKTGTKYVCSDAILDRVVAPVDDSWMFRYEIKASANLRCIWSCVGGGSSDIIRIHGRLST